MKLIATDILCKNCEKNSYLASNLTAWAFILYEKIARIILNQGQLNNATREVLRQSHFWVVEVMQIKGNIVYVGYVKVLKVLLGIK